MVYLQRSNIFIEAADTAPWTIFLVNLLKHFTLSSSARVLGHSLILHPPHASCQGTIRADGW
jgi:hypothetical protein